MRIPSCEPRRLRLLACLSATAIPLAFCCGCRDGHPATYPVRGTVRFANGDAVPVGIVEFRPQAGGIIARGKIDARGHFVLGTFAEDDGAVAGEHRVVVIQHFNPQAWTLAPPEDAVQPEGAEHDHDAAPLVVHTKYAAYGTSPLRATIEAKGENLVELTVEPAKIRSRSALH